ncbi:MAG: TraR/DksA C4-type zinc finger protein [Flavobacteriales bacterium]|nr:TraR/DksA C4-type zinc finger protein [Flavobacteriales bacterium]
MAAPTSTTGLPSGAIRRFSAEQMAEFRRIIEAKLSATEATLSLLESSLLLDRDNGTDDTSRSQSLTEDGQATLEREEAAWQVGRQRKFRAELRQALARIEQGTYGICRITGQPIPVERLRAVPHATLCVEAKD